MNTDKEVCGQTMAAQRQPLPTVPRRTWDDCSQILLQADGANWRLASGTQGYQCMHQQAGCEKEDPADRTRAPGATPA